MPVEKSASSTVRFSVGQVPVYGDLILSPMDGYSDQPFRSLARKLGSAMSYTEFINALDVLNDHPNLEQRLSFLECERPVVYQIFDDDPSRLLAAARKLRPRNPDIIDINMGCSAKQVSARGAGAGLLREPRRIAEIFTTLSREMDIPITGKIRLGWDDVHQNYLEVARIVADNGGKLLAVHGRTKKQGYSGQANWDAIAAVKQAIDIPVVGNGDVQAPDDIDRMLAHTGCDAVMIARAAIGNPWIFSRRRRDQILVEEVRETLLNHLSDMLTFYGQQAGLVLFRKHAVRYLSPYPLSRELRTQLLTRDSPQEFIGLLDQILPLVNPVV